MITLYRYRVYAHRTYATTVYAISDLDAQEAALHRSRWEPVDPAWDQNSTRENGGFEIVDIRNPQPVVLPKRNVVGLYAIHFDDENMPPWTLRWTPGDSYPLEYDLEPGGARLFSAYSALDANYDPRQAAALIVAHSNAVNELDDRITEVVPLALTPEESAAFGPKYPLADASTLPDIADLERNTRVSRYRIYLKDREVPPMVLHWATGGSRPLLYELSPNREPLPSPITAREAGFDPLRAAELLVTWLNREYGEDAAIDRLEIEAARP